MALRDSDVGKIHTFISIEDLPVVRDRDRRV